MKALTLHYDSWHRKLNELTYGEKHVRDAKSMCPYFWGTILAVFLFPLTMLIKFLGRKGVFESFLYYVTAERVLAFIMAGGLLGGGLGVIYGHWLPVTILYGIVSLNILAVKAVGNSSWAEKEVEVSFGGKFQPLAVYMKASKAKYCPMINWVAETESTQITIKSKQPNIQEKQNLNNISVEQITQKGKRS